MTQTANPLAWFPYYPRPQQGIAVKHAADVFSKGSIGLLSADCGVGKTIATLSGYLAARSKDPSYRLVVLTRTHSQSNVFEEELAVLREKSADLRTTSMVSRRHVCPMRGSMESESSSGFLRACSTMIATGRCTHYWNFYEKSGENGLKLRKYARERVNELVDSGVVTRERAENEASDDGFCPYELLRWCARNSNIVIGPYSYLFKERVRHALLSSLGTSLQDIDIVVDEAHNLPSHVLDSETSSLSGSDIKWLRENKAAVVKETEVKWLGDAIEFLWTTLMYNLDGILSHGGERVVDKWDVVPRFVEEADLALLLERTRTIEDTDGTIPAETPLDKCVDFLYTGNRASSSDDWHVTISVPRSWSDDADLSRAELKIRPLNAAGFTAPVLAGARAVLLMSGTLRPTEHYARLLGIRYPMMEDLSSPYPTGSRMVLIDKELSTAYKGRSESLWREIAGRIEVALTTMPANKSALIAFPSYQMMQDVLSYGIDCGSRERMTESRGAKIEVLKEAVEDSPHAVFSVYGGKYSEGVDLVQDGRSLLDLIIGVGIPFSPPTSYQKALQGWYEKKFGEGLGYYYSSVVPSIRSVAQLAGRLRRSPEDWGIVLLLDKRFLRFSSVFGGNIASDMWPYTGIEEMRDAITLYIEQMGGQE